MGNSRRLYLLISVILLLAVVSFQFASAGTIGQRLNEVEKKVALIENSTSNQDQTDTAVKHALSISGDTVKYVGIIVAIILPFILLMIGYQILRSYQFEKEIRDTRKLMNDEYDKMTKLRSESEKIMEDIKTKVGSLQDFVGALAADILQKKSTEFISQFTEKTNQAFADIKTKDEELKHNIELMKKLEALDLTLTPTVYKERGNIYFGQGNLEKAIDNYSNAIRLKSDDIEAFFNRGLAHHRLQKYREAIQDYEKVIQSNPKYQNAYANMGVCYRLLKEYNKSLLYLNKAIELNPNFEFALIHRGITHMEMKKVELALADFGNVEKINPESLESLFGLGFAYGRLGDYKKAIAYYKKVLGKGDKVTSKMNLAEMYLCDKDYDNALKFAIEMLSDASLSMRDRILSRFIKVAALVLSGSPHNDDLQALLAMIKESTDITIRDWSFDELISCIESASIPQDKLTLLKRLISLLKREISPDDFLST